MEPQRKTSKPRVEFIDGDVTVDAALVASRFNMDPRKFLDQLRLGKITSLFEKGEGIDAGRCRITFYNENQRTRFIVDHTGEIILEGTVNFGSLPLPPSFKR